MGPATGACAHLPRRRLAAEGSGDGGGGGGGNGNSAHQATKSRRNSWSRLRCEAPPLPMASAGAAQYHSRHSVSSDYLNQSVTSQSSIYDVKVERRRWPATTAAPLRCIGRRSCQPRRSTGCCCSVPAVVVALAALVGAFFCSATIAELPSSGAPIAATLEIADKPLNRQQQVVKEAHVNQRLPTSSDKDRPERRALFVDSRTPQQLHNDKQDHRRHQQPAQAGSLAAASDVSQVFFGSMPTEAAGASLVSGLGVGSQQALSQLLSAAPLAAAAPATIASGSSGSTALQTSPPQATSSSSSSSITGGINTGTQQVPTSQTALDQQALAAGASQPFETMMTADSKKKKKKMSVKKKKKKMEKKHKEWKKGKKHKKKKYESKKKKGGSSKKKKGKKEKKKWGMEKKGHKKKGNFKKKKWGHKKKMKKGHKKGKKGHKMLKDKGHKKKGFKKVYHKEEWGKKKKWHDIKREKKWNTKQKKWKKKWHQEKGKKYKGKHMKKYHKKNKHGKKYKKEKKEKYKKHKGEKFKKGHKKKKEEYSKKKEGGKKKKMKKMEKKMKKKMKKKKG